jgi:putative tryptophan/tyrosine transport system substrate-binding protein
VKRRFAIALLVGLAAPRWLSAGAVEPTKTFRIGTVSLVVPRAAPHWAGFEQRLRDLGFVEGQNLAFDFLFLEGKTERLSAAMAELVRRKVDVIVAGGTEIAVTAALRATDTIPIVMVAIEFDPLSLGYVRSLARPGGNVTGVFLRHIELTGKRLDLLKETIPGMSRAVVFWDARSADQLEAAKAAAQTLKLPLKSVELRDPPYDYTGALEIAGPRPGDALLFSMSGFFFSDRDRLVEFVLRHQLPSMFGDRVFADMGGLISYGPSIPGMYQLAAEYVGKILKGTPPADLPIEMPTRFELVVNLKTAKALGLTVPPSILARADEVIE